MHTDVFGKAQEVYLPRVQPLFDHHHKTPYTFVDEAAFKALSEQDRQRVYWSEMLQRAHLGALGSILRAGRWATGTLDGLARNNLLAATASLRGLIEAAADSVHGLGGVPETLAYAHAGIEACLAGSSEAIVISTELENRLVHFLYGRKLAPEEKKTMPETHRALRPTEYNQIFEQAKMPGATALYALLCQFTHPAAHSLAYAFGADERGYFLRSDRDGVMLASLVDEHRETLIELLPFAMNPALLTLAVINKFSIVALHTPQVNAWNFATLPLWQKCLKALETGTVA